MEIELLDEKKTIKQLVAKTTNSSILEFIKKELDADKFNFIITAENMQVAKDAMASLNKSKDFITAFRKEKVNAESVAIDSFKENVKEYIALIEAKREKIKKDVEVFEKEKKDSIAKELSLYTDNAIKEAGLRYEFSKVDTADLIKLGSVNPSGSLKKATTETIDGRVLACKSKQDKYDNRLLRLENESFKAGLQSPLNINHVQGIINLDDDEVYQNNLKELIASEIARQNTIKENLQKEANEKAQREAHQEVLDGQRRIADIFSSIDSDNNLSIDDKILAIEDYDCSQFAQLESFARSKGQLVVSELRNLKDSLEQAQKNVTVTVADKEIPVVYETIDTEKEKEAHQLSVNNGVIPDTPKVEDGKKVVLIDVHLQFKVKDTIPNEKIINKVNLMLTVAGFDESLIGVEVVS